MAEANREEKPPHTHTQRCLDPVALKTAAGICHDKDIVWDGCRPSNQGALSFDIDVPLPTTLCGQSRPKVCQMSQQHPLQQLFPPRIPGVFSLSQPPSSCLNNFASSHLQFWDYGSRITVTGYARSHLGPGCWSGRPTELWRGGVWLR